MKAKVELACKIEKEGGRMECSYVSIIIGGGKGDEGALFCKTKGRETAIGLAGTRVREVRGPTLAGSPPFHPARL